jgi:hypothetical protein
MCLHAKNDCDDSDSRQGELSSHNKVYFADETYTVCPVNIFHAPVSTMVIMASSLILVHSDLNLLWLRVSLLLGVRLLWIRLLWVLLLGILLVWLLRIGLVRLLIGLLIGLLVGLLVVGT